MDNPIQQRLIVTVTCMVLFVLLGWDTNPASKLPDDRVFAAGEGIARPVASETRPARLHSIRGVTQRAEAPLAIPELEEAIWEQPGNDFADVGNMDPSMLVDDTDYPSVSKKNEKKKDSNNKSLNAKASSSDRFLKDSEGALKQGWLGESITDAEMVDEADYEDVAGRYDPEFDEGDIDGAPLDLGGDAGAAGDTTAYDEGYDNYLYEQMGDSGESIGFDSLDEFESYAPEE